jgi:hypothetical protein
LGINLEGPFGDFRAPNIAVAVLLIPRLRQVKSVVCHGEEI